MIGYFSDIVYVYSSHRNGYWYVEKFIKVVDLKIGRLLLAYVDNEDVVLIIFETIFGHK